MTSGHETYVRATGKRKERERKKTVERKERERT